MLLATVAGGEQLLDIGHEANNTLVFNLFVSMQLFNQVKLGVARMGDWLSEGWLSQDGFSCVMSLEALVVHSCTSRTFELDNECLQTQNSITQTITILSLAKERGAEGSR